MDLAIYECRREDVTGRFMEDREKIFAVAPALRTWWRKDDLPHELAERLRDNGFTIHRIDVSQDGAN